MTTFGDVVGYLTYGNPISQGLINTTVATARGLGIISKNNSIPNIAASAPIKPLQLHELIGSNYHFIRLAGVGGAAAVIMGALGTHYLGDRNDPKYAEEIIVYERANRFHFLHSFALLAVPLARHPKLTGTLMTAGTVLFSGTMYYRALTRDKTFVHVATFGGFCLIAAWLSLIF